MTNHELVRSRQMVGSWIACAIAAVVLTACSVSSPSGSTTMQDRPSSSSSSSSITTGGPDDNVPVNVFVADDNALESDQVTELIVVLNEEITSVHGDQTLKVTSTYVGNDGAAAADVWAVAPDGEYPIVVGEQFWRTRVKIKGTYLGHGILMIKACTMKHAACPAGEEKYTTIEVNPIP